MTHFRLVLHLDAGCRLTEDLAVSNTVIGMQLPFIHAQTVKDNTLHNSCMTFYFNKRLTIDRHFILLWISEIVSFLRKKFHHEHIFDRISNLVFAPEGINKSGH